MTKLKGKEYLLKCSECEAQIIITVESDPPGFLPVVEYEQEAKKHDWQASILRKDKILCPVHHQM